MKALSKVQKACLTYYLWVEIREGERPAWRFDPRPERWCLDAGFLDRRWVRDPKTGRTDPRLFVTEAGEEALRGVGVEG